MNAGLAVDLDALLVALAQSAAAGYALRVAEEDAEPEAAFRRAGRNVDTLSRRPLRHPELHSACDDELRGLAVEREHRGIEAFRRDHERRRAS